VNIPADPWAASLAIATVHMVGSSIMLTAPQYPLGVGEVAARAAGAIEKDITNARDARSVRTIVFRRMATFSLVCIEFN
jgi:hypothetical protein